MEFVWCSENKLMCAYPEGYSQKNWLRVYGLLPNRWFSLDSLFIIVVAGKVTLNLWRGFVDGLVNNDEKVASYNKHAQFNTRVKKAYTIYEKSWPKSIPYLWLKWLRNHTLWGRTCLYSPYNGVLPPLRGAYAGNSYTLDGAELQKYKEKEWSIL